MLQQPENPWVYDPQQHRHTDNAVGQASSCVRVKTWLTADTFDGLL